MSPNSAWRWKFIAASCGRRRTMISRRRSHEASVQFGCEPVDFPSQLGVGLELEFLCLEVVIGLRLLERRLPILADHHEGRQEDRLQRDHQGQCRPRTALEEQHPYREQRRMDEDKA